MNKLNMTQMQYFTLKAKLPKKIFRKFVFNIKARNATNQSTNSTAVYSMINQYLTWSRTKEGKPYWHKLHNKWCIKEGYSDTRF